MVTRTVKYSLAILGVLVVALLVAPFFIDVESYKPEITKAVEDATGRKMEIGKIEASLFPWVGVRLEDVHLANRAGFSDHDFLSIESLQVKVALLPLLSKEIEIKQFRLVAPELFMERNAEGAGNWEDLTEAKSGAAGEGEVADEGGTAKKEEKPSRALAALNAESLQMTHGRLILADAAAKSRVELSEVTVEINDVQLERPVEMTASARLGEDSINLQAQVGPINDFATLNVERLPLQATLNSDSLSLKPLAGILPELPESVGSVESSKLRLNVKLEQRPDGIRLAIGNIAFVGALTAESSWKAEMSGSKIVRLQQLGLGINGQTLLNAKGEVSLGNRVKYQLRIEGEPIQRSWLAGLLPELNGMYAANPAPWQQVKFGALIAGDAERVELRDLQLMLDRDLLQASGVISFDKAPDIRLRVNSSELHIDPWLPQSQEQEKNKKPASVESELAAASAPAKSREPDLRAFANLRISSQMQIETLHLKGLKLEHLRASLSGNRGQFTLDPLRFDLSGGQVTEKASLNLAEYPVRWTETVHVAGVPVAPVLKAFADLDILEGKMQMDADLKASGLLPDNSIKSLNGNGKVLLSDGSIKGFDIAGTLRNLTTAGQPKGSEKTDFSQLQASFTIKNGMVKNDDLFMASPLFRLTGNGTINLPKGIMDYHVKPKLVGTLVGQGDTVTVRKGLAVPLHIRGPFKGLRVTPEVDTSTLIENIEAIKSGEALKGVKEAISGDKKEPGQQQTGQQQTGQQQTGQQQTDQQQTDQQQTDQQQTDQQQTDQQKLTPEQQLRKTLKGLGF